MMKNCKTIAMYLPQFHRVPENDKWWGNGFTEWMTVKNAKSLFPGHIQPRHPLDGYYYNLLEKDTMIWQANLMQKYGIDAACFYHYYFKDGRKILEKPAENLLRWKDISMDFCFAWDVGSWARTWSNISGNSWVDDEYEPDRDIDVSEDGVLLEQDFGREESWRDHFEYLSSFFKDTRYLKVDDRPVFIFYNPGFGCMFSMIDYWKTISSDYGVKTPYFIGFNNREVIPGLDATTVHAPHMFWEIDKAGEKNNVKVMSFDKTWKNIVSFSKKSDQKVFFEGFANYDDTPRRSNTSGMAFEGYDVEKFRINMEELYLKSFAFDNEFVFFNAWNEWGEGMYLEPDEEERYARLEAICDAKKNAQGRLDKEGDGILDKYRKMIIDVNSGHEKELNRARLRAEYLSKLLDYYEGDRKIRGYFDKYGIKSVAVYGYGQIGMHLIKIFKKEGIHASFVIDGVKKHNNDNNVIIYNVDDELPDVDAIVITPMHDLLDIYTKLRGKVDKSCRLISIKELME